MRKQRIPTCVCGHIEAVHFINGRPGNVGCMNCTCGIFTDKCISYRRAASKANREAGPKREIMDLLKSKRIRHWRMNSGDILTKKAGSALRKVKGNVAGTPDILCLLRYPFNPPEAPEVIPLWIETKSHSGKQSPEQIEFQRQAEANGETYLLAKSAEDVKDWLETNT